MFINYFKVALRNLRKHPSFSFINIFGLATSMSVCLLAIMLIKDAHSFDLFHPESEQTYRIVTDALRKSGGEETYASSPHPVARDLFNDFSYVDNWVPVGRNLNGEFSANGKIIQHRGLFTNDDFFKVFGFELESGDLESALKEPYSLVLKNEVAKKYFGDENPIGKVIENETLGSFKVSGVLKEIPGKTHFEFDVLAAFSTLSSIEENELLPNWLDNWNNYYSGYNYIKLGQGTTPEKVEAALAEINKTAYSDLELEARDRGYRFRLQPLEKISPGEIMSCNMGRSLPKVFLWFLSALAIIIILSACFNYTNLTVARSLTRAKEVGVRKVLGATRGQVFSQFISESIVTSVLSLVLGYLMLQVIAPQFSRIGLFSDADISFGQDAQLFIFFFGFTLIVALVAGLLPAVILSRFSPLSILQKMGNTRLFRRVGLRKVLVVGQFTISLVFILMMTIIWRQTNFSVTENFASDRNDIVNVRLQGESYEKAKSAFEQMAGVERISGISHLMGTWEDGDVDIQVGTVEDKTPVRDYFIDHSFIENFQLKLLAGENFPKNTSQQKELFTIVNENFLDEFDLGTPAEAIGQQIILEDSTLVSIRGVVEDFLFKPINYSIEPLLLRYDVNQLRVLNIEMSNEDMVSNVASLERTWNKLETGKELSFEFYDETTEMIYADFFDLIGIVGFFGILGLVIATLGILGMAIFTVEKRAKEISIRKVIGANAKDLIYLLSKGYMSLLLIAVVLAVPISIFLGKMLLQTFAVSIPMSVGLLLPGVGVLLLMGIGAIGSQTVHAALANPIENLKEE